MKADAAFLFVTCQIGAEPAVKAELARRWPAFRFAYSRPGFLTFKLPYYFKTSEPFALESVFARAYGFSLGKATGKELAAQVAKLAEGQPYDRLHAWSRDEYPPGEHGYQPGATEAAAAAAEQIRAALGDRLQGEDPTSAAREGETVLDCVLVKPDEWWIGWHRAGEFATRYPGGMLNLKLPEKAVSRAWLKMEESLRWSQLPIRRGDSCSEIGCAPGGSCQALLRRGLVVVGVDPAAVDPVVLEHPRFTQIRKRGSEVRRREFRNTKWLTADMNVAPTYTLDTVESIVTYPQTNVRGLLLTLKLPDWDLANELPQYFERIRSWGYDEVRARQLQYNRQEVCVAALKT
jgi:23S rRNA (cytidine2498-2'-O)-methyltransferase